MKNYEVTMKLGAAVITSIQAGRIASGTTNFKGAIIHRLIDLPKTGDKITPAQQHLRR